MVGASSQTLLVAEGPTIWDYKIVDTRLSDSVLPRMDGTMERKYQFAVELNMLGADGWELTSIAASEYVYIFKRPRLE